MIMENLTIDQHWDTLHYALIQGVVISFKSIDSSWELHVLVPNHINYVGCDYETCYFACAKVLSSKILLLEG
jgi:hypothetical protein